MVLRRRTRKNFPFPADGDEFDGTNDNDRDDELQGYFRAGYLEALFGLVHAQKLSLEDVAEYAGINFGEAEELLQGWEESHDPERIQEVRR